MDGGSRVERLARTSGRNVSWVHRTKQRYPWLRGLPFALLSILPGLPGPAHALDPDRAVTQYLQHHWTAEDGLPAAPIRALTQDPVGYLWVWTSEGSVRFDGKSFSEGNPTAPPGAASGQAASRPSVRDRDGNLWESSPRGLIRHRRNSPDSTAPGDLLSLTADADLGTITSLLEDREGSLWIGTEDAGLFRLDDGDFLLWGTAEGLSSSAARTVFQDHSGTLWIGTDGGGLNRLQDGDVTTFSTEDGLPSNVILSICETRPGTLWIGTAGGGLSRFRDGRFKTYSTTDGLTSAAVTSLLSDRQRNLWIGTAGGGLNRYRRGQFDAFTTEDGLSDDIVRALLQDRDGDLWIGTDTGLNRFRNGNITTYSTAQGLAGDQILALHQDRDGVLWIGTDAGLSRKDGEGFISFKRRQGLFSEGLGQILDDSQDRLWFCSQKGLFYLEKPSLERLSLQGGRRVAAQPIPAARHLDCSGYNQPAAWGDRDGHLWFATNSGVLELDPQNLSPPPAPPVVLERVRTRLKDLSPSEPGRLPVGRRDIEFHYTALSLKNASQVRFRVRLDPFDPTWIDVGTRRSTRYTNLPTGSFRFRVAASVGGPWSQPEAVYRLAVPKPMYRTKAAVSAFLLLGLVLGRGVYQLRVQHLVRRNRKLAAQVAEGTRQVEAKKQEVDRANQRLAIANRRLQRANEELFELDQENTDFLALAAHDLREPLVTLQGFAGELHSVLEILKETSEALEDLPTPEQRQLLTRALTEDAPEALSFIDTSTERMDQLIHGLMSLSRLGRQKLHFEPVDLEALVREVLRNLGYQISSQGVEVETRSLPSVVADRASLKLVFENLLNNAILYLQPGRLGRILISGEETAEGFTFSVSDNGRGISEAARPKIFQVFGRGDPPQIPGEGLGLAFVRAALERHGGSIDYQSQPGEGTTFIFSLPHLEPEETDV